MSEARLVYNRRLLAWLGLHSETVSKQARGHRRIRHPAIRVTNQLRPLATKLTATHAVGQRGLAGSVVGATQPGSHERVACMPRGRRVGIRCPEQPKRPCAQEMRGVWNSRQKIKYRQKQECSTDHKFGSHPGLCVIGKTLGTWRPWPVLSFWCRC